jgi:hypothetical protein
MLDVAVMGTGSMEGAMQFCRDNAVSLTDTPVVGTVYVVSDAAIALAGSEGAAVLKYFAQNGIVIGTLGNDPPPPPIGPPAPALGLMVVLRPVLDSMAIGSYSGTMNHFKLVRSSLFVNVHTLATYGTANDINITTAQDWNGATPPTTGSELTSTALPTIDLEYDMPYPNGLAALKVYGWAFNTSSVGWEVAHGWDFRDSGGNRALYGPVIQMAVATNSITAHLCAKLTVTLLSSTGTVATLKLVRAHGALTPGGAPTDLSSFIMSWRLPGGTLATVTGSPDVIYVNVPAGTYTFGVLTTYMQNNGTPIMPSVCDQVVTVA